VVVYGRRQDPTSAVHDCARQAMISLILGTGKLDLISKNASPTIRSILITRRLSFNRIGIKVSTEA